jgi:hypothetical protein
MRTGQMLGNYCAWMMCGKLLNQIGWWICRVSREDEENGWENGWGDDDAQVVSPQQKRSSSNSPPRGTGVGKLKKGTFAKKKPANWSNDF